MRPTEFRFEIRSKAWAESPQPWDTIFIRARPGEDLDGPLEYRGWLNFGRDEPFVLDSIVDFEHAWIRFSGVYPVLGAEAGVSGDSILVSTVWRSFHTASVDAGMDLEIRIASAESRHPIHRGMRIFPRGRYHRGAQDLAVAVQNARAIGLFRMIDVHPIRGSFEASDRWPLAAELVFEATEMWKGTEIRAGDTLSVLRDDGVVTDTTWRSMWGGTPLCRGWSFVLLLQRRDHVLAKDRWDFSLPHGYTFVIDGRVFSFIGLGDSLSRFRDDILFHARNPRVLGRGVVAGRLRRADFGEPVAGVEVSLRGLPQQTRSSANGRFELVDVPIGYRLLVARDACGESFATVEVTDERMDSLDVVLSCPERPTIAGAGPPERIPPSPPRVSARKERLDQEPSWTLLPIDVWPTLIAQTSPDYPPEARARAFEGDVYVQAWIDSLGLVQYARVSSPRSTEIDAAAEACVRAWRFRPALGQGRPIACSISTRVHFAHPRSPELVAFADLRDTVSSSFPGRRTGATVTVEVSATLDSITGLYSYSYRVLNSSRSAEDLAAFALMSVSGDVDYLQPPVGWNAFVGCDGRRDVLGCNTWGDDRDRIQDHRIPPGEVLEGFRFISPHPPGKVCWFARTNDRNAIPQIPWRCSSSDHTPLLGTPLEGFTTGPVQRDTSQ